LGANDGAVAAIGSRGLLAILVTTPLGQRPQIAPTIGTLKLAGVGVESLRPHRLIEPIRRVLRVSEQEHGEYSSTPKARGNTTQQHSTEALTVVPAEDIDLIKLALESRHTAVVWRSFRKIDQFIMIILDNECKPIAARECREPLVFP
jgi:hypothetical protein